jgi:hypothetical protein
MIEGIDCASTVSNPAAVRSAGKRFVCRYVSTPGSWKNASKSELAACRKAGLAVVLVWETTATAALAGEAAGRADAKSARAAATGLGFPANRPVYLAVDFDAQPSQMGPVCAYFKGARDAGAGPMGVYGGLRVVTQTGMHYRWQTLAWSGGVWDPKAQIQQYAINGSLAGIGVDYDRATQSDYGQWPARSPYYLIVWQGGRVVKRVQYGGGRVRAYLTSRGFVRLIKQGAVKLARRRGGG